MQKRTAWREQEQRLVERWNAATERYRMIHEEISGRAPAQDGGAANADLMLKAQAARAEIEALRREVARLKREFLSGERY